MYPKSRNKNLVVQKISNETLVYDLESDKAFCLSETISFVWRNCDGKTSANELAKHISKKYGIEANEDFINLALHELKNSQLLRDDSYILNNKSKVSRRNLITQYGIPMAVLPIVMSVVAPVSAQVGSCIPFGQPCVPNPAVPFDNCCPGVGACFSGTCNGGG